MRVVLFTGKGGVGKTTVSAATALRIAAGGAKTLVMSTDPAHSLGDAFGTRLGAVPVEVVANLWAEQIDPQRRLEENWREIQEHAVAVLDWAGLSHVHAEELSVIPGLDEIFSLADVRRHHDEGAFDVLIVDCAPTGETLRLLSLPDVIQWYMERVFPVERRVVGALRPVAKRMTSFPLPGEDVYAAIKRFYDELDGVRRILGDGDTTSVRLVVNPEKMVIAEAQRTYTYLNLFGYRVDAVIVNRVLPEAVSDPWFERWKQIQAEHLATIEAAFAPVPLLRSHLRPFETVGAERLGDLGVDLYGDADPVAMMHSQEPLTITERPDGGYVLCLMIPFAQRDDLELSTVGHELLVKVGTHRRTIALPRMLIGREVVSARVANGIAEISFGGRRDRHG